MRLPVTMSSENSFNEKFVNTTGSRTGNICAKTEALCKEKKFAKNFRYFYRIYFVENSHFNPVFAKKLRNSPFFITNLYLPVSKKPQFFITLEVMLCSGHSCKSAKETWKYVLSWNVKSKFKWGSRAHRSQWVHRHCLVRFIIAL